MHPYLLRFTAPWGGEVKIASYGAMMMAGFLLCLYILQKRAGRHEISSDAIFNVAIAMLISGVIGARLFYVIQYWERSGFSEEPLNVFRIDQGGLVFYGGLIGGLIGAAGMMLHQNLKPLLMLGLIASVGPLGHAFGRMGCFLNGCCFGRHTTAWIGIRFPRFLESGNVGRELLDVGGQYISGSLAYIHHLELGLVEKTDAWSKPVHATQLYAVVYNLAIFALLSWCLRRTGRPEAVIPVYMISYGTARFFNEMFRVTEPAALGLSIAQVICIPLIILGAAILFYQQRSAGASASGGRRERRKS